MNKEMDASTIRDRFVVPCVLWGSASQTPCRYRVPCGCVFPVAFRRMDAECSLHFPQQKSHGIVPRPQGQGWALLPWGGSIGARHRVCDGVAVICPGEGQSAANRAWHLVWVASRVRLPMPRVFCRRTMTNWCSPAAGPTATARRSSAASASRGGTLLRCVRCLHHRAHCPSPSPAAHTAQSALTPSGFGDNNVILLQPTSCVSAGQPGSPSPPSPSQPVFQQAQTSRGAPLTVNTWIEAIARFKRVPVYPQNEHYVAYGAHNSAQTLAVCGCV